MTSVDYLVGHVAAGDGRGPSAGSPMTRYCTAEGYPPGTWLGSGLASLGAAERAGTEVTEEQLRALFEHSRSPFDGTSLGRPPVKYPTRQDRIARRIGALPESMTAQTRATMTERITAEEQDTKTRAAVAGFDLTFSVLDAASKKKALDDHPLQEQLYLAHRAAVSSTLELVEAEALFTRTGARGARRVRTNGMIAAAFDHWDSRKGDPPLHTHVTIANRVQGPAASGAPWIPRRCTGPWSRIRRRTTSYWPTRSPGAPAWVGNSANGVAAGAARPGSSPASRTR